jgi:hypothetical protein
MTISGVSHYRGGTIDEVVPLAKALKAAYLKHGIGYRLSRFETGPNVGDWFVVVQFADQAAYEKAQAPVAQGPRNPTDLCRDCKDREADHEAANREPRRRNQFRASGNALPSIRKEHIANIEQSMYIAPLTPESPTDPQSRLRIPTR